MPMKTYEPRSQRGKRALADRQPKIIENTKEALYIRGLKTSDVVTSFLKDIVGDRHLCAHLHLQAQLKKPFGQSLNRRNAEHPFENDVFLEKFARKNDASLFAFVSHNKKRPHNLVIGRHFDHRVLDMVELGVSEYCSLHDVRHSVASDNTSHAVPVGTKPALIFNGADFASDPTLNRIRNLFTDFFRGESPEKLRLQGVELAITFTALAVNSVQMNVYKVLLKQSGSRTPRVELVEIGPRALLTVRRHRLAGDDVARDAHRVPKTVKPAKQKNISRNVFGSDIARVHVGKQPLGALQIRKHKAIKRLQSAQQERPVDTETP